MAIDKTEDIRIGEVIDSRYQLKKFLGGGRVGKVYLCRDLKNNTEVAIKILTDRPDSEREKASFHREFEAIKTLKHPGVVRVYEEGDGYFTMEYVDGVPLSKRKGCDVGQVFEIAIEITRVLDYIHRMGVIHRDLKTDNIRITAQNSVKVLDFGFAISAEVSNLLVAPAQIAGTLNYMSPEAIKGFPVDPRADLYSLGMILYELLTGRLPFQSTDILTTVLKQVEMTPPSPSELNPKITPGFEAIVMKLIAKSPVKRYQSAEELLSAMMKLAGRSEIIRMKIDRGRKFLYPPKFAGRSYELQRMSTILKRATKGRGSFVLLRASAGMGKTRLLHEFQAQNRSEETLFLEVSHDNTLTGPLSAFAQLVYTLFKILEKSQASFLNDFAARWGPQLLPIVPALAHKPYMANVVAAPSLSEEALRQQMCRLFIEISKVRPLGIFIDNLDWLDSESCYLLVDLVQEAQEHPIFLCGAYRGGLESGENLFRKILPRLKLKKICEEMELKALAAEELSVLVTSMIGREKLDGEILQKIYEVSRGIPLLAEEVINNMADDGLVYRQGGVWYVEVDDLRKIRRPNLLEDALLQKYEKLEKTSAYILQIAAVIGHRFPRFLLEKIAELGEWEMAQHLPPLTEQGFISEIKEGIQSYILIGSPRLAELIYENIPVKTRCKLHEDIANVLENCLPREEYIDDIARHYLQARKTQKALHYLLPAGEIAERNYAYSKAIECYQNALDLAHQKGASHVAQEVLLQKLGNIHLRLRDYAKALEYYQRGLDLVKQKHGEEESFHKGIGTVYFHKGQYTEALQHFEILLQHLRTNKKNTAEELTLVAAVHIAQGSYEEAGNLLKEALTEAKQQKKKDLEASIYHSFAEIYFMRGHWKEALHYYSYALEILQVSGDQHLKAQVSRGLANLYLQQGHTKEAYKYLEDALYFCHLTGDREMRVMVEMDLGVLLENEGKLSRAMQIYSDSRELAQELEMKAGEAYASMHLARCLKLWGRHSEAVEMLRYSLKIFQELQNVSCIGDCYCLLGEVYAEQGEYEDALRAFNAGDLALRSIHIKWKLAQINTSRAVVLQKLGEVELTNKSLNKALTLAKKYGDEIRLGRIHTQYALFCASRELHKEALEHFVSAVVFLQRVTSLLDLGITYYEYGRSLLMFEQRGDRGFINVAIHQLEKAKEIFGKAGLEPLLTKVIQLIKECERQKTDIPYKYDLVFKLREFSKELAEFERESAQEIETCKKKFLEEIGDDMEREKVIAEMEKRIAEVGNKLTKRLEDLQTQNAGLLAQVDRLKSERESLLTLQKISNAINSVLDSQKLLNLIMDMVLQELRAERGFVVFKDEKDEFTFKSARNIDKEELSREDFQLSCSIVKKVMKTGEAVLTSDAQADGRFQSQSIVDLKLRSILCVPFKLKDRVIGAVYVDNRFVAGLFTEKDLDFLVAFSNQAAVAIENAFLYEELREKQRMEQELSIAARIQAGLLPKSVPQVDGIEIYGTMVPAREVGGDYYDFIVSPDNSRLSIAIGDVSGKGIGAGLVMVMARLILHQFLRDNQASTKETLVAANRLLKDNTEPFIFMSLLLARWNSVNQKFTYTGAGHENLIICRAKDKNIEVIPAGGVVLGVKEDISNLLEEKELVLEQNDSLVLYTDGATESISKTSNMLELNGFVEMVRKHQGKAPKEMVESLLAELKNFTGEAEQHDDITLTVVQRKESTKPQPQTL